MGIARTFQNIRLFSSLTVLENVLIAKHMRAKQNVFSATFRTNRTEAVSYTHLDPLLRFVKQKGRSARCGARPGAPPLDPARFFVKKMCIRDRQ